MEKLNFVTVVFTTFFMTGLIWFVQIVHYPLFARVGESAFSTYELLHTSRTGMVVAPIMVVELISTFLLLYLRPSGIPVWIVYFLCGVSILIWLSTFFIQVPLHGALIDGFDKDAIQKLVRSNWIRTVAWSVKSLALVYGCIEWLRGITH